MPGPYLGWEMWLILEDWLTPEESEPDLVIGLMQPSQLHLASSTSAFSHLREASDQVAERKNWFLCWGSPQTSSPTPASEPKVSRHWSIVKDGLI